ncbi:Rh-like protein/ammonium transporter [Yamadazyma tenuis ATCC 10573]|nr:Rh-like protein/ammonium transporter [Yamadazyma tenuis ATCC 10573]EGV62720.1 Rh-like protein/ammonium transporter [Yamadazyma tenuis ATCC 10573]
MGELDFAGGGPVHVSSGVASLVYSWYLGPREQPGKRTGRIPSFRGYSSMSSVIGVTLIWAAWLCFNSGTLLAVNIRTGYIFANTMIASAFGCVTYVAVDSMITGKYSMDAACEGVIVGLVNITPSCGYYWPWAAAVTSIIDAVACRLLIGFNKWTGIDDYSKSWVVHGVGGIIGGTLVGIFGSSGVAALDGVTVIEGGWVDGNFRQLGIQIAAWVSITAWTGIFTLITCFLVDHIPGLKLRATAEAEEMGMDLYEMAETLDEFGNDYETFFIQYASKLRQMADHLEKHGGVVEVLDGSSTRFSARNSHSSIQMEVDQKV